MVACFFGAKDDGSLLFVVTEHFDLLGPGVPSDRQLQAKMELHRVGQ